MSRCATLRLYLIALLPVLAVGSGSPAAADGQGIPELSTACNELAADPFDPNNDSGYGVPERHIRIPDAYFTCKNALEAGDNTPRTMYQLGRAALAVGDLALAEQAGRAAQSENYPAANGLIVRLFTRSLQRTLNKSDDLRNMLEAADDGGYPHVYYQEGQGLEQLVVAIADKSKAAYGDAFERLLKSMTQAYGDAASKTNSPQAWYRYARAQFLHRQQFGPNPVNESAEENLARAVKAGSPAAVFYSEAKAAVEADLNDETALLPSLKAWRRAWEDGVREAVEVGLMQAVDWSAFIEQAALEARAKQETEVLRTQVTLFRNNVLFDPYLNTWYKRVAKLPLQTWGISKAELLAQGLARGVLPAGQVLMTDASLDLPDITRDNTLLAAALNADSRDARWIRELLQRQYLAPVEVSSERLRIGFEIAKILNSRKQPLALVDAALVAHRLGNSAVFEQGFDGFFQQLAYKPEGMNDREHESAKTRQALEMIYTVSHLPEPIPELHRKALTNLGSDYVRWALDTYNRQAYQAYKDNDIERMDAVYAHGEALADLDRNARKRFDEYLGRKVPSWKRDLRLRTKPVCERYQANVGKYLIKADRKAFNVNRYDQGAYEFSESTDSGNGIGYGLLIFIDAPDNLDANPHGFSSDERWMWQDGEFRPVYDSVFGVFGWHKKLYGKSVRDRILQGGGTTLSYQLGNGERKQTNYDFTGFRGAYEQGRDKHREIRRLYERLECR